MRYRKEERVLEWLEKHRNVCRYDGLVLPDVGREIRTHLAPYGKHSHGGARSKTILRTLKDEGECATAKYMFYVELPPGVEEGRQLTDPQRRAEWTWFI